MTKSRHGRFVFVRAHLCVLCLLLTCAAWLFAPPDIFRVAAGGAAGARQTERLDLRMRSFAPPASGNVTVEPSGNGGSGRLTVLSLPDPRTISPDARTYVVWAVSEGRIARLGELKRDERGNGGLAFERPDGFERYSVVITAESSPDPERPGSPVLSTRANEATTLYPTVNEEAPASLPPPTAREGRRPAKSESRNDSDPSRVNRKRTRSRAGDFFAEVDHALKASGGGRVIEFQGEREAARASGTARTATHSGSAYVRANFRGVPLPSVVGASVYILWAIIPDGRIVYMGSLPSTEDLNAAQIYVRTAGFGEDPFELFVTAERRRPAPSPSGTKVLTPRHTTTNVR